MVAKQISTSDVSKPEVRAFSLKVGRFVTWVKSQLP